MDEFLLKRSYGSAPYIFSCLGHQLAAASQVRLLQRAVREVELLDELPLDPTGRALAALKRVCVRIREIGEELKVIKNDEVVAFGWNDPRFVVDTNEAVELGTRK